MPFFNTVIREAHVWLAGSVVVAVLWTNLAWLFSPWAETDPYSERSASLPERIVSRVANWRFSPLAYQGLRLVYYVGLPAAALFWGRDAVVARFLGLQRLPLPGIGGTAESAASTSADWSAWANDLGWAVLLGTGATGLLLLARFTYRQALPRTDSDIGEGRPSGPTAAREALYRELHWAFYRNAPMVVSGTYWGTWLGLVLVALEALSDPAWRRGLRESSQAWPLLAQAALAVVSSVLFLRTQNLWLALVVHWGISWALEARPPAPSPTSPNTTLSEP